MQPLDNDLVESIVLAKMDWEFALAKLHGIVPTVEQQSAVLLMGVLREVMLRPGRAAIMSVD